MKRSILALLAVLSISTTACSMELEFETGIAANHGSSWDPPIGAECASHAFTPERPLDLDIQGLICYQAPEPNVQPMALTGWIAVQPTVLVSQQAAELWVCGNDVALEYEMFAPLVQDCAEQLAAMGCRYGAIDDIHTALNLCYQMVNTEWRTPGRVVHSVEDSDVCGDFAPLPQGCI